MNMKKILIFTLFSIFSAGIFAQSNDIIDDILKQDYLSCGNGSYLVLTAGNLIADSATVEDALSFSKKQGWISEKISAADKMSLGQYSLAVMKTFKISGGMLYTLFPSARYASRELGYLGYISRDSGSYRNLNGNEAISIIGQIVRDMESPNE